MPSSIFSRITMKMQSQPIDRVITLNLFSLVLELSQHPRNFITQMGRVS